MVPLSFDVNMGTSDDGRVNITDGAKVAAVRALLDKCLIQAVWRHGVLPLL